MNFGAFFKVVAFIAPTLAFVFYFVAQQQDKQTAKIEEKSVSFDRDFAQMNAEFADDKPNSAYWNERKSEADGKIAKKEANVARTEAKSDQTMKELEKGMSELSENDFKELKEMANQ